MRKPNTTDDIGIAAKSNESTDCKSVDPTPTFSHFFVSFWTRIKFFFTNTLTDVCKCSAPAKAKPSDGESLSIKFDDAGDIPTIASKAATNTINTDIVVRDHINCHLSEPPTGEVSSCKCEETSVQTATESNFQILLRESSQYLETFYDVLDDTEPIVDVHLEPVYQSDGNLFSGLNFAKHIIVPEIKSHFSNFSQFAKKKHFFEALLVDVGETEVGLIGDVLTESLCSSSEVSSDTEYYQTHTLLSRFHNQPQNGDVNNEEHLQLDNSLIAMTLPHNCDSPVGTNQLCEWQPPHFYDENEESKYFATHPVNMSDSVEFVDSILSVSVEHLCQELTGESNLNAGKIKPEDEQTKRQIKQALGVENSLFSLKISDDDFLAIDTKMYCSDTMPRDDYTHRSKRSSSLKSDHSPLGTPCRKIVRFADSLGLDLATVRHVKDADHPPLVPASATLDLQIDTDKSFSSVGAKQFQMCFPQPGASATFMHRVLNSFVCLENARVDSPRGILTGTVRVKSVGFDKKITIRITYNNWVTFSEVPASYVQDSHDGSTDRFSFSAVFPPTMVENERIQFAVRYDTHSGTTYWDNNYGENYQILCYAKATDITGDGSWIHYL